MEWVGHLGGRRPIGGAVLDWAYSPGEFKVELNDGSLGSAEAKGRSAETRRGHSFGQPPLGAHAHR